MSRRCALACLLLLAACEDPAGKPVDTGGDTASEWTTVEIEGPFVEVDAYDLSLCAIEAGGQPRCWGSFVDVPADGLELHGLSVGYRRGCALTSEGEIACWGDRTGDVPTGSGYLDVGVSSIFDSCALDAGGAVVCWGGDGHPLEPDLPSGSTQVAVDGDTVCVIDAAGHTCWEYFAGAWASTLGDFVSVVTQNATACTLHVTGQVECYVLVEPLSVSELSLRARAIAIQYSTVCGVEGGPVVCEIPTLGWDWYLDAADRHPVGEYVAVAMGLSVLCTIEAEGDLVCTTDPATATDLFGE